MVSIKLKIKALNSTEASGKSVLGNFFGQA
jgi:hypothetical protein